MRGYYNLVEGLWRLGRYDEAARTSTRPRSTARTVTSRSHAYMFAARRCRLLAMRGRLGRGGVGLRELLAARGDPA